MYICICQAITDGQIRKAAESGVQTVDELRDTLGVASCCGSCAEDAAEVLATHAPRKAGPAVYRPAASNG